MEDVLNLTRRDATVQDPNWRVRVQHWLRRLGHVQAGAAAQLRIEGRVSLGPKKALVLVNCCGNRMLLAISGDAVTPVMEIPASRRQTKPKQERAQ